MTTASTKFIKLKIDISQFSQYQLRHKNLYFYWAAHFVEEMIFFSILHYSDIVAPPLAKEQCPFAPSTYSTHSQNTPMN